MVRGTYAIAAKLVTRARRPAGRRRAGSAAVRVSNSASTRGEKGRRLENAMSAPSSERACSATEVRRFWVNE
ncbi:MAG: hypothetical protein DMD43_10295, partial [Gemmatimonadetes bacterium]